VIKYHLQFLNHHIVKPISAERISAVGFYNENKDAFDNASKMYTYLGIDIDEYV